MKYRIPIKKDNFHKASLMIFNQLGLNLTELELNLLSTMLSNGFFIITKEVRVKLRELLKVDTFTLNNYVKRLKDKNIIVKENNELKINENLKEKVNDKEIHIIFDLYDN